jgi:predicted  nucleic acid-binding Zn-ribbon protein
VSQIKLTLRCPQCGGTKFKAPSPNPGPNASLTCAQCGTTIDLAAEKKRLEDEARPAVEERLRGELP